MAEDNFKPLVSTLDSLTRTKLNTDYHKCVNAKGEDFAPCQQFKKAYRALCPNEWVGKWDEQVEAGTFPASLKP
ncbi:cytochrome c oxidase subunit 6B [Kwoniella europaea PYCC6329]|uniref:Cytochrome c oxidase subunit 6B n=1 Tax=Kwoniella europaea PYCC6329 TaxID=1423913 RepID=A0AAX4KMN3_9TREE